MFVLQGWLWGRMERPPGQPHNSSPTVDVAVARDPCDFSLLSAFGISSMITCPNSDCVLDVHISSGCGMLSVFITYVYTQPLLLSEWPLISPLINLSFTGGADEQEHDVSLTNGRQEPIEDKHHDAGDMDWCEMFDLSFCNAPSCLEPTISGTVCIYFGGN